MVIKNLNIAFLLTLLLTAVACEDNQPVELVDDSTGEGEEELEVIVLPPPPDPSFTILPPDTTGLDHTETSDLVGLMIVTGVQFDLPDAHHEVSFAHAIFLDPLDPILELGDTIGFRGLNVGEVLLDGLELHQVRHRLRSRVAPFADSLAGFRYILLNRDGLGDRIKYQPNHRYVWNIAGSDRIPTRGFSIDSPGKVNIVFPTAQTPLSKDHPLEILWVGQRPQTVIISGVKSGPNPMSRPLFRILVPERTRRIILPDKVMQLLRTDQFERFLFTFRASNTTVTQIPSYSNKVLLHAASVHNVLVKVR